MTLIQPLVKIRRNRVLPVSGTVLVRVGQKVSPSEVLAESQIPTRHLMIDVNRSLGIKNIAESEKFIDRNIGDQLDKHDIIAETGGLFSKVIRAPMPGKIVSIKDGQVCLEVESRKVVVQSGVTGQVVEILKDRGAIVEMNGALVQGVWGNGLIGFGPFIMEDNDIDDELLPSSLNITSRGTIIAAAFCENEESLLAAGTLPVGGLILGSMNPRLIPTALRQLFPIILLEGFGKAGINEAAKQVLLENTQHEMSINAIRWDHFNGFRPEISVALQEAGNPELESVQYTEGQKVRIHTSPYTGQIGTIIAINSMKTTLDNGVRTSTASILLANEQKIIVPLTNFDIIGYQELTLG